MTLVVSQKEARPSAVVDEDLSARSTPSPRESRARATRRIVSISIVGMLVLALAGVLFMAFEGPIANSWYTTRQHQLAAQWTARRAHAGRGKAVALLQIPRLQLNVVIAEGDSPQQLRSGPGHRMGTPMPGAIGNSVIVGHRTGWGGPLGAVNQLVPKDLIAVQTGSSDSPAYVFSVVSVRPATANDLAPFLRSTDRRLTIVTGTGGRFSDRRLVVTAVAGKVGKTLGIDPAAPASTSAGSLVANEQTVLVLAAIAAIGAVLLLARRRYRTPTLAFVVSPFVVLALLGLLLNVDTALAPLR